MPLPTFDAESDIPEAFRPEYELRDGKWHPKVVAELELERGKHVTLLDETKEAKRLKKVAEDAAAEAKRLLDAKNAGVPEAELARLRAEDEEKRRTELTPLATENAALKAENRKLKLTDKVRSLAIGAGVMGDRIDDAMLFLDTRADLGDEGGIVWKDKDGKVTNKTPEQFFADFKIEKPYLFAYEGGSGSGTGQSRARTTTTPAATPGTQQRAHVLSAL